MKKDWFHQKIEEYSGLTGYVKPDLNKGSLKLDSNENFVIPKQLQDELLDTAKQDSDIRQYPLGRADELVQALSEYLKVPSYMIGLGNGSDQILDLILANFASKQTKTLTSDPTFGFFEERCKLYSVPMTRISFSDDMTLDVAEFLKKSKDADILYLDTPNNPTGFQFPKKDLEALVSGFSGMVILDEAYGEFADYSAIGWPKKYDNLIVVQTFSKSFGLAGLRLGYYTASKAFAEAFNRVIQYPYPINTIAIGAGIAALRGAERIREYIEVIKQERKRIIENLKKYDSFEVFDSKANFVLFDANGADKRVYTALVEQGISVRKLGKIGRHKGCMRVTIGTKEMNSKFLLAIRDFLG